MAQERETAAAPREGLAAGEAARLPRAAVDCRFLLGRGYPRQATLTLVGNRYQLTGTARQLLHRGVFAPGVARQRRRKLVPLRQWAGARLAVDGHNVVITLECARRGLPLVAADDGFIRDVGALSRAYRPSDLTTQVVREVVGLLATAGVRQAEFWYDAPMSRSGELAALTRTLLETFALQGDAQAVAVPETRLLSPGTILVSSDTALIDACGQVADVAGELIRQWPRVEVISLQLAGKSLDREEKSDTFEILDNQTEPGLRPKM